MLSKKSYGILCFKKINDIYKILIVKKKYTFAFADFVFCNYETKSHLKKILNNTTFYEKYLISTYNFKKMWEYIWENKHKKIFKKYKKKFYYYMNKLHFFGFINYILEKPTKNVETIWEIPKGKPNKNENYINCAKRELLEEGLLKDFNYKLYTDLYEIYSYIGDNNKKYEVYIICALMNNNFTHEKIVLNNEICKIRWVDIYDINKFIKKQYILDIIESLYIKIIKNDN